VPHIGYRHVHCGIVPLCQSGNATNPFATRSGLSQIQSERLAALREQIHARSDNEVFDYLVTVGTNQRDDLEQLVYALFGNLADSLARRFQSPGDRQPASSRFDRHVHQYALTALPEVPTSLIAEPGRGQPKSMSR